jgi:MFS family permease
MVLVLAQGLVPPAQFATYIAVMSSMFVLASVLGPVLGGVINNKGAWRWVFLLRYTCTDPRSP